MINLKKYTAGIDIGSTTAKIAMVDESARIIYSEYKRHNAKIYQTVDSLLENAGKTSGNCEISLLITGSAGIGVAEKTSIPFIQEIIASTEVIKKQHPSVKILIDIGGEDSKMIFFHPNKVPDIRMNGSCAGGTGAFIDQMANLLNVSLPELNELAKDYKHIYPIASRCGVFAKTDIQNLVSRKIPKQDIAASIFHAVAIQTINTLARGIDITPKIMFAGGPFTFLSELSKFFLNNLKVNQSDIITPTNPELLPALGAAIIENEVRFDTTLEELREKLNADDKNTIKAKHRLPPLFNSKKEFDEWDSERINTRVKQISLDDYKGTTCCIGIDSGSTTTKIVAIGSNKELLFKYYHNNNGNAIDSVIKELREFNTELKRHNKSIRIVKTAVTGYGEDLIKAAFGIDIGMVETIAHYTAAKHFNDKVTFILDIGGQDMKSIFINNGIINRIELNESCSSGCGSFIETFSNALGHKISDFAQMACESNTPCDLGTRCTVFMNSKVKQSLRENAYTEDIAAGLSYSVIKNALYKVLKLKDISELGEHIVVQGGAFKNPSIHRALELMTERKVICSDIPEQMGAYGAAIIAHDEYIKNNTETSFIGLSGLEHTNNYPINQLICKGCENNCTITKFIFSNNNVFYSGNKCEKTFSNKGTANEKGFNLVDYKYKLLFNRNNKGKGKQTIGIPRVLNTYENFPFWNTLLTECGFNVKLSSPSTMKLYEKGLGTVMSDSICFPAKLVHGHIIDLAEKKVNRIFYPLVIYETNEYKDAQNSYNCPIVTGYPDVIRSSVNIENKYNIPFDSPTITFNNESLLKKACYQYLKKLGVSRTAFNKAFQQSLSAQKEYKAAIRNKAKEIIDTANKNNRLLVVLGGRPYHADPLINQMTPDVLTDLGVDVITEDAIPGEMLSEVQTISQWAYPNRIYNAAHWIANQNENIQFIQLNSFGCGPDTLAIDETIEILKSKGKNHTLIRIDEITSTGSIHLRLRSMIESLKLRNKNQSITKNRLDVAPFEEKDTRRTILAPQFSEIYSRFFPTLFELSGYKLVNLPPPDKDSVEYGLKYSNNEICYPATIIVGDIIKALKSGKYNLDDTAIGITQTGGQCRASSYLSLIKKGLIAAGYSDVPVIAISAGGKTINNQPGFNFNWKKVLKPAFISALYADSLAKMYYSTVVREVNKGESKATLDKYLNLVQDKIKNKDIAGTFDLLRNAVYDFNDIEVNNKDYPKIGIVGEIYVKYNSFGNYHVIDWLISQGIEVVVPPLVDFFMQIFVNTHVNKKAKLQKTEFSDIFAFFIEQLANKYIRKTEKIISDFRYYKPFENIKHIADKASNILNLANQFGEGWLIPAEIASFADEGINNVVSLQPFGCIANQIISKGVEKRIKDLYPEMNILFLDFDSGTSDVNILNRLHFMVKNVNEQKKELTNYLI